MVAEAGEGFGSISFLSVVSKASAASTNKDWLPDDEQVKICTTSNACIKRRIVLVLLETFLEL
ncbi:MAG: hypothetical protein VYC65_05590 [Chloroflexota bacterium]|nr:hypothetical protein [Chloroflexota bacterium]